MAILNLALRSAADSYRDRPAVGAPVSAPGRTAAARGPVSAVGPMSHPAARPVPPDAGAPRPLPSTLGAPAPVEAGEEWRLYAECGPGNTDLFYSKDPVEKRAALAICHDCPVRRDCLAEAMEQETGVDLHGRYGIRGGMTPVQRRELARSINPGPARRRRNTPTAAG
ncbi:MAG TPA: WhiB family transcriptional regulator [Citricoccus sp.]